MLNVVSQLTHQQSEWRDTDSLLHPWRMEKQQSLKKKKSGEMYAETKNVG